MIFFVFLNDFISKNSGNDFSLENDLLFSLNTLLFYDKKDEMLSVMIRGKSPLLPKRGSRLVI